MDYIVLTDVHKSFVRKHGAPTLREHMSRKQPERVDRALRGVTLRVARGEAVAVLGRARSGRSTLISLIRGLHRPDSGSVQVRGTATGTPSMGAGFSPGAPVTENLALNAMLLGMTKQDLDERLDSVLEFAGMPRSHLRYLTRELEPKRRNRLVYSMVLHAEPDVFVADGAVTLGDDAFRTKSLNRLIHLRDQGQAMVLVTQHRPTLRRLCSRGVVLDGGLVIFDGELREAFSVLRALREKGSRPSGA